MATRIGWIVDGTGRVTGLTRFADGAQPRPAPPFDPAAPAATSLDGVPVSVLPVRGDLAGVTR